ncbi:MAG: hypothetical protein EPN93_07225 [Spirochaetes bacterium]|nr:MAG: hypothetical protein EPN93_07225 [Spirochaetota bacterium]
MKDFTIISYPGANEASLLSLAEKRSRYMLPFGGRYRVVDFTIRNSVAAGAQRTIIYSSVEDSLADYVEHYGPFKHQKFPAIRVVSRRHSDIQFCYNLIMDANTDYYVIYAGDNPSIIDFSSVVERYRKKRAGAALFTLKLSQRESMAHGILVTNQKTLLEVVNGAMEERRHSPNIFEMIINVMINRGIRRESLEARYWPVKNVPEYYQVNMDIMRSKVLFETVFSDRSLKSQLRSEKVAFLGPHAKIINSFISDGCQVHGTVQNSIVFPGVEIGERAVVRDSILLPFCRIGAGARVFSSVIDEKTLPVPEIAQDGTKKTPPDFFTVGAHCYVGSETEGLKNNDFPRSLFKSITLIGRDCEIPDASRIGGACYIAPGLGREYFLKSRYLYDGLSVK